MRRAFSSKPKNLSVYFDSEFPIRTWCWMGFGAATHGRFPPQVGGNLNGNGRHSHSSAGSARQYHFIFVHTSFDSICFSLKLKANHSPQLYTRCLRCNRVYCHSPPNPNVEGVFPRDERPVTYVCVAYSFVSDLMRS